MQADDSVKGATREASAASQNSAGHYEIRVKGHLDARWIPAFDGMHLANENDGTTIIHGPVVDQAALHGLLQQVRDLGIALVSVTQVKPDLP